MLIFADGPAKNQVLPCRRAPLFLRAVFDGKKWDALDQTTDTPNVGEDIHVYARVDTVRKYHVSSPEKNVKGWYEGGIYSFVEDQPGFDATGETDDWRAWCYDQKPPELWSRDRLMDLYRTIAIKSQEMENST